ncbi:17609_t:CDS:10 [Acaulospora morrowiae]|uniref:ATP-binding cassette sub-family B member 6 n=1 Tax=Acaulospora morrowiae TaxID=94023 RepID=A0A9N8WAB4_9GLOM|nr:17609_t:CDS:10 [Acaulospora morrowiae]
MFQYIPSNQSRFCLPSFEQNARISPCGLHTLIGVSLLAYPILLGTIRWALSKQPSSCGKYSSTDDEDGDIDHSRQGNNDYPESLHKFVIATQYLVGFVTFFNVSYIMFAYAEERRVETVIPSYIITSTIFHSISWIINCGFVIFERNVHRHWSYFTQGFWYWAFLLANFELYNRLVYISNPDHEDGDGNWSQSWMMLSFYLLGYVCNFMLVICAATLTFLWRRSHEARGYVGVNFQVGSDHENSETPEVDPLDAPDVESQSTPFSMADDPKYAPPRTFSDFLSKCKKLLPFVWPAHDIKLQIAIVICMLLLLLGRVVNVLLPYQYKVLVERLSSGEVVWKEILFFVGLRWLQGDVGVVSTIQGVIWIPVGQFTTREISVKMLEHLLNLSLRFHLNRKTGEILRVQDRGVSSIVSILSSILFDIIPTLVDVVIAVIYFTMAFDIFFGLIVFITMSLYIINTIIMTDWRTKYRRLSNLLDNAMEAKAVDSLLNYETVKLYAAENFEVGQYTRAILDYQLADQKSNLTMYILNTTQNLIIQIGLLTGSILCATRVSKGEMTVGDFVMYLTYILQLYGSLNWFGNYYRVIQKNFVDMEKMLDLLQESPEIKDLPQAAPLTMQKGEVIFDNVSFSYDTNIPTLRNVSFTIPSGSTVALVGPSGGGKSTIMRLLFRFYDVQKGRILVDGQDIRHIKQHDLRSCIGIVPQETVLFNDTIKYNIRYGKIGANDQMVEEAAKAAQIHDKILGFTEGYETKVGERGLRLSGGEKQRVAIARTLLKNPQIVLLDEATSALDTRTERHIQKSLRRMTVNRTTLIIAHRLSTIVHADQILVLQDGEIVERGSHVELLQKKGEYYKLWNKQLKHHEKMKKEIEISESIDASTEDIVPTADTVSTTGTVPIDSETPVVTVEQFTSVEESVPDSNVEVCEHEFVEEEGADGDDERQTTTACESSDDEGEDARPNQS